MASGARPSGGVAAIGECMIEISDARQDRWRMGFAGDTLNTLWYLRALLPQEGADFVSAFGDDVFSQKQRAFLDDANIGTAASPVIPGGRPGLYAITLEGAERSFTYWRSDSAARSLARDADALRASLLGRRLVYFTGITLAILTQEDRETLFAALSDVRANGGWIAFDPNHRPRLWPDAQIARDAYHRAFALSDFVLPTFDDEAALHGDACAWETVRRIEGTGPMEIVVKCGAEAALVWTRDTSLITPVPARQATAVDTTGAGDSFCGGYLAGRLAGYDPVRAAALGHAVAARVIAGHGALLPMVDFADLRP